MGNFTCKPLGVVVRGCGILAVRVEACGADPGMGS